MFLRALEIKNYRSLEHVELNGLSNFNVLIGRNNSGKSSVFGALALLNDEIHGKAFDLEAALTARDAARSLELRLLFDARPEDREVFINKVASELPEDRREAMRQSALFRQVEFSFKSHPETRTLSPRQIRLLAQDSHWAVVLKDAADRGGTSFACDISAAHKLATSTGRLDSQDLNIEGAGNKERINIESKFAGKLSPEVIDPVRWLLWRLSRYLNQAFFFHPFRHSEAQLPATQTDKLAQNGSNLAQVLNTISSGDRPLFAEIEKFIHTALPDIGVLQTPLTNNNTEVSFRALDGGYRIRLPDMGGGIEQLLMVATVLLTTGDECTLFLEEPESHLHAGAQRFLNEKLGAGGRQVFISTHSPVFVNSPHSRGLYQTKFDRGRTTIARLKDTESLSIALEDIGSRNSDVLLSDAVLFVEGPGDKRVFEIWSDTLGLSLERQNVTIVPMGGGDEAARGTRIRSEVLEGISKKSPVPHLFILDRDERSNAEVSRLQGSLHQNVYLLERRELENYLLVPRALLAAIRSKHLNDATIVRKVEAASERDVDKTILLKASGLRELVLLKRIRAEIAGLKGGLLGRESIASLIHKVNYKNFPKIIRKEIESRVAQHLLSLNIDKVVDEENASLDWSGPMQWLLVAPGEEVISAIFHEFGSEYSKPNDTIRIAREMTADEIAPEIQELVKRVILLTEGHKPIGS
jgi:predicted ATPase